MKRKLSKYYVFKSDICEDINFGRDEILNIINSSTNKIIYFLLCWVEVYLYESKKTFIYFHWFWEMKYYIDRYDLRCKIFFQ